MERAHWCYFLRWIFQLVRILRADELPILYSEL
jgi:hypothetical protein